MRGVLILPVQFCLFEHTFGETIVIKTSNLSKAHEMRDSLFAHCLGLSSAISSQFTLEMCIAAENCKIIINTH